MQACEGSATREIWVGSHLVSQDGIDPVVKSTHQPLQPLELVLTHLPIHNPRRLCLYRLVPVEHHTLSSRGEADAEVTLVSA